MKDRTKYLSVSLDSTDVTEIGLKSLHCVGLAISGTGVIMACFHCCGTTLAEMDWFRSVARGAAKDGSHLGSKVESKTDSAQNEQIC